MDVEQLKNYASYTKMTFSYKAVLLLILLEHVDKNGRIDRETLVDKFHDFYLYRQESGLVPEKDRATNPSPLSDPGNISKDTIWALLTRYPLSLMKEFIRFDENSVQFHDYIWNQMKARDVVELRNILRNRLEQYYAGV